MNQNQGAATPCAGCNGTGAGDEGIGGIGQAPFSGQLLSVTIYTLTNLPNQVLITDFGAIEPSRDTCSAFGGTNCATGSQASTLLDAEAIGGLSANTFTTITLANPPTVSNGHWIGVVYMMPAGASSVSVINFCNQSPVCAPGGVPSNYIPSATIKFLTTTPTIGNSYNTVDSSIDGSAGPGITGETFGPSGSQTTTSTTCYGNCGSPAITLANTNSTHTVTFNQSATLYYEFQSNVNGFILNETTNAANTNRNNGVSLATYLIPSGCPAGQLPFTPNCPGFLTGGSSQQPLVKGRISQQYGSGLVPVANGEWIAIAVSCTFQPCDLNDTNTVVSNFFQTNFGPVMSTTLTTGVGPSSSKLGLWVWIVGNVVTGSGSSTPPVTSCAGFLDCIVPNLVFSFCNAQTPTCVSQSALLWSGLLALFFSFFTFKAAGGIGAGIKLPIGEVFLFWVLVWIFIMSGLSLLFVWVPLFFFFVISLMYGKHTGRYL